MNRSNFKGADWIHPDIKILIVGAGGIGSWVTFLLARIGYRVTVVDFDRIEPTNIGGQLFRPDDIGSYKVVALANIIQKFSDTIINKSISSIESEAERISIVDNYDYVIAAVDNMEARRFIFEEVRDFVVDNKIILIDGRLEMEMYQRYFINNEERIDKYSETLGDINDSNAQVCSLKQTSHIAAKLASDIVVAVTNSIANKINDKDYRKINYFKQYNAILDDYIKL